MGWNQGVEYPLLNLKGGYKEMLKMDSKGQANALVAGILAVYIALTVVFALNTANFDSVTLSLWGLIGLVIIGSFITRIF